MMKRIIAIGIFLISLIAAMNIAIAAPAGKVVWVKGSLTASGRPLGRGSHFAVGEVLSTGSASQAEVVFRDGSLMTFKEGTNFTVTQLHYDNQTGSGQFSSNLTSGGFRTITGVIAKSDPNNYQVNTPVATIGVRGTDYQAVLANGALYVAVFDGGVCLDNNAPGFVDRNFLNWMSNPAVYMPQVLAVPDERLTCPLGSAPFVVAPFPGGSIDLVVPFITVADVDVSGNFSGTRIRYSLVISPALHDDDILTIDPITGVIHAEAGDVDSVYNVSVVATNPCGSAVLPFTFTVTQTF